MLRVELADPDGWTRWRDVRLRALADAPDAFGSHLEREASYAESDWRERLAPGASWIATVDGVDVGIVSGGRHHRSDVPWVFATWVDPSVRGTGVAEALLGAVVTWAREQGATTLGLDVADRAPRAKRFYERLGFVADGHTFPMPRDPTITLVEMYLDLADGPTSS